MPNLHVPNVVVTGSRKFRDGDRIEADLRALQPLGLRRVAQGGNGVEKQLWQAEAPKRIISADTLAWVATHRLHLEGATYRVDARLDGRWPVSGPRRNRRMLKAEKPALVLAYPTRASKGTWSCVEEAARLGIPALVWVHWATNSEASRIVADALEARGVRLAAIAVCGPRALLGMFDRDEHRVLVGQPGLAAALPQELNG